MDNWLERTELLLGEEKLALLLRAHVLVVGLDRKSTRLNSSH